MERNDMVDKFKTTDFALLWVGGIILMTIGAAGIVQGIFWHYLIFGLGLVFILFGLLKQRRAIDEQTEYGPNHV